MLKFKNLLTDETMTINVNDINFITHEQDYILIVKKDYIEYKTKTIIFV